MNAQTINEYINSLVIFLGENTAKILFSLIIFFLALKGIQLFTNYLTRLLEAKKIEPAVAKPILLIFKVISYIFLIVTLASFLGLNTTSILVLIIIVAIVLVIALQSTLANIGAGIMLIAIKPFHEGNYVEINGNSGYLRDIGLYHTLLVKRDNSVVFVPNAQVLNTDIVNMEKNSKRRVDIDIYVSNTVDILQIRKTTLASVIKDKRILNEPSPIVIVSEIKPYGLKISTRLWVKKINYWDVLFEYNESILSEYKKLNVKFPNLNFQI